ncbi:Origin recognition complex subunit 4, partial [Pseudolycoriella hygida]
NDELEELNLTKRFIKDRLQNDKATLFNHSEQRQSIYELLEKTITFRESNIALLIGVRGSGKTTLLSSVLQSVINDSVLSDIVIVRLHGLVDTSDAIALASITKQLQLEETVNKRIFGSFAEHLAFLLTCLKSGREHNSKSVCFILEDFHLFCDHTNQTLLYNLFDSAQSDQTPICVIGLTSRFDAVELLEKRVKSRFSHRQILLNPKSISSAERLDIIKTWLSLPTPRGAKSKKSSKEMANSNTLPWMRRLFDPSNYKFTSQWVTKWNSHVVELMKNDSVIESFQLLHDYDETIDVPKKILFQLMNGLDDKLLSASEIRKLCQSYNSDDCVKQMIDLSVLEICLLIAIKHHSEIYDNDPFNFEIILTRLNKFIKASRKNPYDRSYVLAAFEKLQKDTFICLMKGTSSKVQKEFQMNKLNVMINQINKAVSKYPNLPTEIRQWAQRSLI